MRFTHGWIKRALTKQKALVVSELREVKMRVFKRKSSKPIIAGIALAVVGVSTAVAFALAVDPGANSKIDYSMGFDGTTTYARTSNQLVAANSDFTVEAYINETVGTTGTNYIWSQASNGATSGTIGLGIEGIASNRCLSLQTPNGNLDCSFFNNFYIPQGDWLHIGLKFEASTKTYTLFVNGNQIKAITYNTSDALAGGFAVGGNAAGNAGLYGNGFFSGQIDEVKVFNTLRTVSQDATDTNTYLASNTAGLVAQYDFNEGYSGAGFIYDRTNNNDLTINGAATFTDIAQYSVPDRTTDRIRFSRSYLTVYGGWFPPAGVTSVNGNVYGAGGGGGGGSAYDTVNGGGGGGGGAGTWTGVNGLSVSSAAVVPVKVGLGGPGGYPGMANPGNTTYSVGTNGFSGQSSTFNATTIGGGTFGYAGGYASGTATVTAGLGGKGGNNGASYTGSSNTTSNDGGGGAGGANTNLVSNTRAGSAGVGVTGIGITGNLAVGGSGGYGGATPASATYGTHGTPGQASGGGGGGGLRSATTADAYPGGFGSSGTILLSYAGALTPQANDYLYTFNGSTQYAESMAGTKSFDVTGDFTLETWVKPTDNCPSATCVIMGRDNNYLLATSNGTYRWKITTNTGASTWYDTGVGVHVGQWQHVALVRSAANVLLYLNGQLASTQTNGTVDASGVTIAMTATSQVGGGWFELAARGVDHQDLFAGGIDDVRIWNNARSATVIGDPTTGEFNRSLSIAELASANLIAYWDMNDTIQASQTFVNRKTGSTSLTDLAAIGAPNSTLNGVGTTVINRYLNLNSANSQTVYGVDSSAFELTGSNFTISAWWKVVACNGSYLVSKANSYMIGIDGNCKINFALDPGSEGDASTWRWMNTGYVMSTATWHYVSLVKVGTTVYLYVDGVLASTVADGDTVDGYNSATSVTALIPANLGDRNTYFGIGSAGQDATRTSIYSQSIDDVRMWNTDRRSNQALDMAGFVPHNSPGIQAMFTFDTMATNYNLVPNRAAGAQVDSALISSGTSLSTISDNQTPPPNQPTRKQTLILRSVIKASDKLGTIDAGVSSADYWIGGAGGGGGAGGNSGYSGGGGGAGALVEGSVTGLVNGTSSETVTVQKVGVGGLYAVNNGDTVTQTATNGLSSSFTSTGVSLTAAGGGAGGSGTATPANARQGASGASGGGSGQTGGAGGTATAGNAGGAGSVNAAGGGGGLRSAGAAASSSGAGGAGGRGALIPLASPLWALGGGTGFGSSSAVNANASYGATAAGADASAGTGSGGGGSGFASAGTGSVRGGFGGGGFIQIDGMLTQPYVESASTSVLSGAPWSTPLRVSLRGVDGTIQTGLTSTITVSTPTAGCSTTGSWSYNAIAGEVTLYGLAIKATSSKTCLLSVAVASGGSATLSVSVLQSPASITVSSTATTGTCSFTAGWFTCPDGTVANLSAADLNLQLNARDVWLAANAGNVTVNSGLSIAGSVGQLTVTANAGNITLNSGIQLSGQGKAMTFKATGYIFGNTSATSGAQTVFSTNGGDMFLQSSTASDAKNNDNAIKLSNYNSFITRGGKFTATGGTNPNTGYASGGPTNARRGINLYVGTVVSTDAGDVLMRGELGGNDIIGNTPSDAGLGMEAGSTISTTSGVVNLYGLDPGFTNDTANSRVGVKIVQGTITTDSGDIYIDGNTSLDSASACVGVYLSGANVTSRSGAVYFNGVTGYTNGGQIRSYSPQSTIGSATGNVTFTTPANTSNGVSALDYLTLTGAGTHSFMLPSLTFGGATATSLQFYGSGDLVISSVAGAPWFAGLTIPANADFGTGYNSINIGDQAPAATSKSLTINATLRAATYVKLRGNAIAGTGAVVAPSLAIQGLESSVTTTATYLSGQSDVDTLAIGRAIAPYTCAGVYIGINDADGWTPGTVSGVSTTYGVPSKLAMYTQPSTNPGSSPQNAPLPTQPVVQVQDAYGCAPTNDLLLPGYTITGTSSAVSGLSPVVSDAAGKATFANITPLTALDTSIQFNSSPTLTGILSGVFRASASATTIASAQVTAGSTAAISGTAFTVQPKVTYKDAYGNAATLASSTVTTTAALTSYPTGASAASLTGTMGTWASATSTGSAIKITGPTGSYTITFTASNGMTSTLTVAVTGWSLSYGSTTLAYQTAAYPATFQGNGTGTVSYSASTTPTICTVNATTGALTVLTAGTCTVTATQQADATYSQGSSTVNITVASATQSTVNIRTSSSTLVYGGSVALTSDGGDGVGLYNISVKSGNCSMSGNSLLVGTAHAGDTCDVWAYRGATAGKWLQTYSAPITITIAQAAQATLNAAPTGKQAGYGNAYDLANATSGWAWGGTSAGGPIVFSTSTSGCSITGTVLTSTAAIGTDCVINVQKSASTDYLISSPVTMNVRMIKGTQTVSYVTIASAVRVNGQVNLNATSSSGLTVSYALGTGSSAYCSLSGATVTFTAPGTCVINASQAGDNNYNAATIAPIAYTVSKALQNITFGPLTDDVVRTSTKTVSGTIDSGLAITYSVGPNTTNNACTVTSLGAVSLNAAGTCEIVASQAGTGNYEAATDVAASFTIARGAQSPLVITSSLSTTFAHNIALSATGGNGSNTYVFSATGDCSIPTGTSTLIPGAVGGNCVVTVDRAGDANWLDATSATQTITVGKATQTALIVTNQNAVTYGSQIALTYGGGSGSGAVTWSVTAPCSVNGTTLSVGNAGVGCVLTLSKDGDDSYLPATATYGISVLRAQQAPLTIDSSDHVSFGQTITLSASGGSGSGSISYTTTGTCSITGTNLLHVGVAGSPCTVTATRAQSTNFDAASSPAMTITIDQATQVIGAINLSGMARATGSAPISATSDSGLLVTLTVDSSSASVCSITATILSFATSGSCVVNANQAGDNNYSAAAQVQRTFNVDHAGQTINLVNPGFKRYQDADFSMVGSTQSSLGISYSIGSATTNAGQNGAACSVTPSGTVTIGEPGTCQILADQAGDIVYDPAAQASVTFTVGKALQTILALSSSNTYVYGTSLQLTASGGDGNGALTFSTDSGQDCSIDQNNVISGGDAGSACTVRISKAADAYFEATQTGMEQIEITKASQTVTITSTPSMRPVALGTYRVTASADSGNAVDLSIDPYSAIYCSISGNVVTFTIAGPCLIIAEQSGDTNYSAAQPDSQRLSADYATQTISVTTPSNVTYGDAPFQLQASSDSGLDLMYFSSGSCSIGSTGEVTIISAGHCDIYVGQPGNAVYNGTPTTPIGFDVAKAQQQPLSLTGPTSVDYGQYLFLSTSGGSGTGNVSYTTSGTCSVSWVSLSPGDVGTACEVMATQDGDYNYEPISSSWVTITVNKVHQSPLMITSSSVATYGTTINLTTLGGSGTGAVTYQTSGTCTEQSGILTLGDAGSTCNVSATKAESTNYLSESTQDRQIIILQAAQLVTFTSSANQPVALGSYVVTASSDSGDTITFSINPGSATVCSISGSTVSFLTSGTCIVTADQAGNTNYFSATETQTITVGKATQTITFTSAGVKKFGDASFSAVASSTSGLTITFGLGSGTTNSACSVASDGTVTILDVGICEITGDQAGDATYAAAARATQQININKGIQSTLTMSSSNSVTYGQTLTLSSTGGSGTGSVSYDVSGDCTESNGVLTVTVVGSACQVRAVKAADGQYLSATSVWQTIAVTKANQSTLSITSTSSVAYGDTITLAVTGGSGPTSLSYTTTGTCSVTSGVLRVGEAGSACTVTATNAASNNYFAASSQPQTVTITKAANTVHFTSAAANPTALGSYHVTASADSGDNVSFVINSSSSTVCSISGSTVSFLTSGDCVIDASEDGNDNFDAAPTVQQTVAVAHASQTITFTAAGTKRFGGADFSAQASSTSGLTITYSRGSGTTNTACSVASDGTVTILDVGNCQITANQAGNIVYSAATPVNQDVTIGKGAQATLAMTSSSSDAYGDPLTLTASGGSGTGTVTFAATGDCTISNGVLTVGIVGSTCSVTATKSGDSQYDPTTSAAQTVTVIRGTQAALTMNFASTQTYGTTQTLSTSGGSGGGAVSYSTGAGCHVSGAVLSVGGGGTTCYVTAHKAASANYNAIDSAVATITVDKADQTILSHSAAVQPYAHDYYYYPTGVASSALNVAYDVDSSTSAVCQKGSNYIYFAIAGTCVINYTQAGNANYNAATQVQETITVAKLSQTISSISTFTANFGDADFRLWQTSDSGLPITYALDNNTTNSSCTVAADGVVHIVATGNCYWSASQAGNDSYSAASTVISFFTIDRAQQAAVTLSASATSAAAFSTITVSASGGSGTGAFSYHVYGTCTISGTTVTLGAVGSLCEVWAVKARDDNYAEESSAATTITITRATQATLSMSSGNSVAYGDTITLATSGGSGDGAVTYATTGTCSVTNGVLHVGNASSACTVTATKAQSANYLAASTSAQTITVTKANQTVSITSTATSPTALGSYTVVASANSGLSADVTVDPASSTVCSISGTSVSFLTSGSCVLLADQPGNANFNAASQASQTITVAKRAQTISSTTIARHYFGDANFTVPASSGSGLALSFALGSATTNNACSVNASTGSVTILDTGTCSIDLDQAGNSVWASAARVTTSFAIGKADQTPLVITNATSVTYGDVVNLVTSGGSVNGVAVTYSTTGTCSVTGAQLTFGDAGSACTVTAFLDGNDQYLPVTSATVTVTVGRADQPAFGLGNTFVIVYGHTVQLTPWGGAGDGAVTYDTVGNCSVSVDILTFSGSAGEYCLITARKAASLNYNAAADSQRTFSVAKDNQTISITSTPGTAVALGTYTFAATATSGLSVTASIASASQTVCSISGNTVTYLTAGDCEVIASQGGNTNYNAASSVSQHITVAKKAQAITFPQLATQQFGAAAVSLTATAQSTLQVTYAVDSATTNNSCSVDNNNQTVSLLGAGDCYLTADQAGNDTWSASAQAAMHFTVTRGDQATVSITSGSSVVYGNTLSLSASGGSGTGSFTFAATGTCAVSGSTLTVGDAGSSCAVTATKAQDANYLVKNSAAQTITITRATQSPLVLSSIASVTYGQTLALSTTGGSGTGAVTYTASGSCTVSGSTLTGGPAGSNCVVYATKAQSTNYLVATSATLVQTVAKSNQTITLTSSPSNATALQTYTVVATASSGLAIAVTVDNASSAVCSVSGAVVSFLQSGACDIYVDQSGNSNFNAATQIPQSITVAHATQTITFNQPADVAMYATAPNFGATASSGLTVSYDVTANGTAACSVTTGGALTAIAPGLCEISVSQSGNSVYATALAVVRSFNIIRAAQSTVTITNNNSVDYLGSITLSATGGSGTGAISFTANGTCSITNGVLTVGEVGSSCAVTATKAGDTNYNAQTSATQNITVNQISQDAIIVVSAARVRYGQSLPLVSAGGSGSGAETWSIDTTATANSAGCAINSGALTLSVTTSGACDVVVTKAASRNYRSEISPRFNVTVDKAYQSIAFTSVVPTQPLPGDTYTVAATSTSGLSVSYSVANASALVCSIAGNVVTFNATGDCEVVAAQSGDGRFLAAPTASQNIAVGSLNQVITASTVTNKTFGDPAFVIVGETTSTSPVTFARGANTTNSACSVTSSGVVSILAVGHCEIVLSAASDATYAAASDITRNFEVVADQASAPFVTSVSADNQSITLSFSAPSYIGGSPIRAYGINAYRNGVLAASYSGCASTDTSCTITGLTNGVAYTFRMVAINAAGDGVESSSVGPVTPVTHAEAVRRLTAIGVNTALDVSWLAPASLGGGAFDSYRIYVRVRGGAYPSTPTEVIYDGNQTAKQITGLVNGTSYDVKVVTITTANTVQLVSNTAEVLQYPKTIPDAPQSVSLAPVSASNLLVSWTAPISDGGDAISAYTARIAGGPNCTVAATSNACEVAGLVPGTLYTIDVFATNGAGDSTSTVASITFRAATIAGANQNNPTTSNGSSAGPANPVTVNRWETGGQVHEDLWIALDKIATAALNGSVDGVTISGKLGGKATFKGKGLDAVRSAYIGNHIPVKILKATDTELTVQLPASKIDGWHDMWFFVDSHAIRYVDVVRYGVLQPNVVKWVKGYKVAPKQLTKAQKVQIMKYLKAVGKYKRVDCRGSYKAIHMTCKYIKTLRPAGYVHITKLKVKPTSKQAKVVKLTFTK